MFPKVLLLVVGLATPIASCGNSRQPATTDDGSQAKASGRYRYGARMRSHRVPNFPDPCRCVRVITGWLGRVL